MYDRRGFLTRMNFFYPPSCMALRKHCIHPVKSNTHGILSIIQQKELCQASKWPCVTISDFLHSLIIYLCQWKLGKSGLDARTLSFSKLGWMSWNDSIYLGNRRNSVYTSTWHSQSVWLDSNCLTQWHVAHVSTRSGPQHYIQQATFLPVKVFINVW